MAEIMVETTIARDRERVTGGIHWGTLKQF